MKETYREWSKELFRDEEHKPLYHGDGTISFVTNCDHVLKGIVVLLAPSSKEPFVFCANCGALITTLKLWQEWDKEHREIYKYPWRPQIQFSFSTSDMALRSFWDSETLEELNVKWIEYPRARGLFRNLGKKITAAIRENEELDEWYIWNELKNEPKSMSINLPLPRFEPNIKSEIYDVDFSTISEISDELLLEGEEKEK
ncbi:MAG: hypothetical protein E3J70_01600 [Candidatus Heimdallarchaeota archaeon]|nr:MAG: hypothetical protein E3J70_01600 [Candidatus Heimdallarchaeota archaeon]